MFESVLVANRGEIARRVIRTVQRMGLRAVAVFSEADAELPYVAEADEAILLGPAAPAQSYRNASAVLEAARQSGAQAVHPGYGFLSEDAAFAARVGQAGLTWVGPSPEAIEQMGDKIRARNLVSAAGVPVSRGTTSPVADAAAALAAASDIGFPLMVKASAGGGGMGMSVAADETALQAEYDKISAFAERTFGNGAVL
ncbi:MAG: biotin carboxylase N-terminal domain-containing protein, partial [Actinomycetes bacterium]